QLNNCNPEFLEIRNLFHQTGVRAGTRCMYAGVGIPGESLHMKLVDDRIRLVRRRPGSFPIKCLATTRQCSKRRQPSVWPFSHRQLAIKTGWKEDALRIRVEENLLRVEAMKMRNGLARH